MVVNSKADISKKELDKYLDEWEKSSSAIPDCVEKTEPTESLKILFEKDVIVEEEELTEVQYSSSDNLEDNFDGMEI